MQCVLQNQVHLQAKKLWLCFQFLMTKVNSPSEYTPQNIFSSLISLKKNPHISDEEYHFALQNKAHDAKLIEKEK